MSDLGWYVIQTHPCKERFVRERIEDLGRDVFLPLAVERQRGRRRSSVGPLFPGYLFARLSEADGDLPRARWTHGVRRLLGDGGRPRPVCDAVVELLRARADRGGRVKLGLGLRRGDRVRIVDGPLAGLIGVLEQPVASPEQRVCVLLSLFHRLTRVEVDVNAVRAQAIA